MIFIEFLIFLSTILPLFHMFNALFMKKRSAGALSRTKRFSILIPCYNEEDTVCQSVEGLISMDYSDYEAIYINDGSNDDTMGKLHEALDLYRDFDKTAALSPVYCSRRYPGFYVIDKPNGGKSSALNEGLGLASSELIVTLDADSVLKKDALQHMSGAFEDPCVVAAGGTVHIIQGYHPLQKRTGMKKIVMLQMLEYLKGFYIYKMSLSRQRALAIISGAFGVFRRDVLLKAGGYRKTLGEDIDITMRLQQMIHNTDMKIVYLPHALCYTQCPETWSDLRKQRIRWQKGFTDCLVHYRGFLLKTFLFKSLSFHFLAEAAVVGHCSCLFTIYTYIFAAMLAFGNTGAGVTFLLYYLFCLLFNISYSICAVAISAKIHRYPAQTSAMLWLAVILDILFYRFFNLIMYIVGTVSYFWNRNNDSWNKVARAKYAAESMGGAQWTNRS